MNNSTILRRKPGMMAADMNGETVMMDIETGMYYNLGEVGGRIWTLLENPMKLGQLVACLTAEYDVPAEKCMADVKPFLKSLAVKGLLVLE